MQLGFDGVKVGVTLARLVRLLAPGVMFCVVLLVCVLALRSPPFAPASGEMSKKVARLSAEVSRLAQEQSMPSLVLSRHRNSICYIYTVYSLGGPPALARSGKFRTRVSGTGFIVANGLIATNRHVLEPWYDDEDDAALIQAGAQPRVEKRIAFFPGLHDAVQLYQPEVSQTSDLAIVHFAVRPETAGLPPLPLAETPPSPGDPVVVVGYPMGVTAMLAKSPHRISRKLAYSRDTIGIARDLAAHSLIRPSATYGHLGDVVEEKLIYDALTAQGGSGGPVFNFHGQVVGVNAAYIGGFAGGTLGISAEALKPLIATAQARDR